MGRQDASGKHQLVRGPQHQPGEFGTTLPNDKTKQKENDFSLFLSRMLKVQTLEYH